MLGCDKTAEPPASEGPPPTSEQPQREPISGTVSTKDAELTMYSTDGARRKLWTLAWKSADLRYAGEGEVAGTMEGVSGTIFESDLAASTFRAARARVDKGSNQLQVSGDVRLSSTQRNATARCDVAEWKPDLQVIEAAGNVRIETSQYMAGPFERLWITPSLSKFGEPQYFKGADEATRGR
jgi:hypothetical protein